MVQIKATHPYYFGRTVLLGGQDVTFSRQGTADVPDEVVTEITNPANKLPFERWSPEVEAAATAQAAALIATGGEGLRQSLLSLGLEGLRAMAEEKGWPSEEWRYLKLNSLAGYVLDKLDEEKTDSTEAAPATTPAPQPEAEAPATTPALPKNGKK